jgi:hypothetical protein
MNTYTNLPCLELLFFKVDFDTLKVRVTLKKKVNHLPVPSRDVTYQKIPGGE